jgi:GNAT superfamily N-acetyltransferase
MRGGRQENLLLELSIAELRGVAGYAVACARPALAIFERARPDDRRPRAAIDAAKCCRLASDERGGRGPGRADSSGTIRSHLGRLRRRSRQERRRPRLLVHALAPLNRRMDGRQGRWEQAGDEETRRSTISPRCGYLPRDNARGLVLTRSARASFPRLERSPLLASIDDEPVCAIPCTFVHRKQRGSGLLSAVLDAVCEYAADNGYTIAEGYPVEPRDGRRADSDTAMTGIASAFLDAGFLEVARPRSDRPIMRRSLRAG